VDNPLAIFFIGGKKHMKTDNYSEKNREAWNEAAHQSAGMER
jgi:hypothetical protein